MINFPINRRNVTPVSTTAERTQAKRLVPSSASEKRETATSERRLRHDRRRRRSQKQIMDRRLGVDRRRSRIDFSV